MTVAPVADALQPVRRPGAGIQRADQQHQGQSPHDFAWPPRPMKWSYWKHYSTGVQPKVLMMPVRCLTMSRAKR